MFERTVEEVWPSIKITSNSLAVQYVDLAYRILSKKIIAQPEYFTVEPMPVERSEQAAALIRFALLIEPNSDLALYYMGTLTLDFKIEPRFSDNLGPIFWSVDHYAKAAVFFRRALEKNPQQIFASTEIGILILCGYITAQENDFVDKIIPATISDQAAKIFRQIRTLDFNYFRAISYLASLIESEAITAVRQDFVDLVMPEKVLDQAVTLYRLAVANDNTCVFALSRLATLISKELIHAIPADFAQGIMPTTVAEQAGSIFRRILSLNANCYLSLVGLARLISSMQLVPTEEDCNLMGLPPLKSAGEQAAILYRKAIAVNKDSTAAADAKLELAELIFEKKVKAVASDVPGFKSIVNPISFQLEMMLRSVADRSKVDDLVQRAKSTEEKEFKETLVREREARVLREERQYQERKQQAELQLAAKQLKSNTSTLKRKEPAPVSKQTKSPAGPGLKLFLPKKKKQRPEAKDLEVKSETVGLGRYVS